MVKESYRFTLSPCRYLCVSFWPSPCLACLVHTQVLTHTHSRPKTQAKDGRSTPLCSRSASAIGKSRALPSCENRGTWSRHRQGPAPSLTRPRHLALLQPHPICTNATGCFFYGCKSSSLRSRARLSLGFRLCNTPPSGPACDTQYKPTVDYMVQYTTLGTCNCV